MKTSIFKGDVQEFERIMNEDIKGHPPHMGNQIISDENSVKMEKIEESNKFNILSQQESENSSDFEESVNNEFWEEFHQEK